MAYYITSKGFVKEIGEKDTPYDTESFGLLNWFASKYTAYEIRDLIEEAFPRAFLSL
jgi:hypothetical protein